MHVLELRAETVLHTSLPHPPPPTHTHTYPHTYPIHIPHHTSLPHTHHICIYPSPNTLIHACAHTHTHTHTHMHAHTHTHTHTYIHTQTHTHRLPEAECGHVPADSNTAEA